MAPFRGLLLAGGHGSRLYPATKAVSKQLLTVYDKPLIYYPLDTLIRMGVTEIMVIVNGEDRKQFERLLEDGKKLGLKIEYAEQDEAHGIADAMLIGREFAAGSNIALILGDNIFCDHELLVKAAQEFESGATVFAVEVDRPEEFGIVDFVNDAPVSITEKPIEPTSKLAVTGLYLYDADAFERAAKLTPSDRGELEITDLNQSFLKDGLLTCEILNKPEAWFDCGSPDGMMQAAEQIRRLIDDGKSMPGYIEAGARAMSLIRENEYTALLEGMPSSTYLTNIRRIAR